ncbi:MAG: hypothetical protein ABSF08_11190 [Candidatus Cybelea sp.]|jgi:hypothetical protein
MPFTCTYDLDQRPDPELVNLFQESYRFIEDSLGSTFHFTVDSDGRPNAVQAYILYVAALIVGAADASLTLTLHNLGREARFLGRQIFEYWLRAAYYAARPNEAKSLLLSLPFGERQILDELGYEKDSERYKVLEAQCADTLARHPGFVPHNEPKLSKIVGSDPTAKKLYAFFYRIPSQTGHATGAGFGAVYKERGVDFNSQEPNPNIGLAVDAWIIHQFLKLMNVELGLKFTVAVNAFSARLESIRERLGDDLGFVQASE